MIIKITNHLVSLVLLITFLGLSFSSYPQVGGSGTVNYIPKWNASNSLGNSSIVNVGSNVGIGTASPNFLLHAYKATSDNNWLGMFQNGNACTYISHGAGYGMHINTNNTEAAKYALQIYNGSSNLLFISNGGKVGIGTGAPTSGKLVIENNTSPLSEAISLINSYAGTGSGANRILFGRSSIPSQQQASIYSDISNAGDFSKGFLAFQTQYNQSLQERVRITSDGNVGIGTTAPTSGKLVIENNTSYFSEALSLINSCAGTGTGANRILFGRSSIPSQQQAAILADISNAGDFSQGYLAFQTQYSSALYERMRITNTGYVGIGTKTPVTTLDVNGSIAGSYLSLRSQNTTTEGGELFLYGAGSNTGFFIDNYAGNLRFFPNSNSSSNYMSISSTGNVFIGGTYTGNPFRLNVINTGADEMILMNRGNCKYTMKIGGGDQKFAIFYNNNAHLLIDGPNNVMQLRGDIEVKADGIGDWVFFDDYKLPKLEEVDAYIKKNGHLPGMLSAKEIEEKHEGKIALGDFSNRLLVKIEELTLYTIELNKKNAEKDQMIKTQENMIQNQQNQINQLVKDVESLKISISK